MLDDRLTLWFVAGERTGVYLLSIANEPNSTNALCGRHRDRDNVVLMLPIVNFSCRHQNLGRDD
jgi:hypothetical protein